MAKFFQLTSLNSNSDFENKFYINLEQICTVTWSKIGDLETLRITTSHSEIDPIILNSDSGDARKILAWLNKNRLDL